MPSNCCRGKREKGTGPASRLLSCGGGQHHRARQGEERGGGGLRVDRRYPSGFQRSPPVGPDRPGIEGIPPAEDLRRPLYRLCRVRAAFAGIPRTVPPRPCGVHHRGLAFISQRPQDSCELCKDLSMTSVNNRFIGRQFISIPARTGATRCR
jgi:hypothetical protein